MTDAQLLEELAKREALIVHCSRPGKGDEGIDGLLFPEDLQKAIDLCANRSTELCCSVVWPGHTSGRHYPEAAFDKIHHIDLHYRCRESL
jgi:hypothetical protein